jgi:hypothetical protein
MVCGVRSRHDHGVPTWVKVVLLVGAVVLLGLVDWVINGRALFAIAGAVGLVLGVVVALVLRHRRGRGLS